MWLLKICKFWVLKWKMSICCTAVLSCLTKSRPWMCVTHVVWNVFQHSIGFILPLPVKLITQLTIVVSLFTPLCLCLLLTVTIVSDGNATKTSCGAPYWIVLFLRRCLAGTHPCLTAIKPCVCVCVCMHACVRAHAYISIAFTDHN